MARAIRGSTHAVNRYAGKPHPFADRGAVAPSGRDRGRYSSAAECSSVVSFSSPGRRPGAHFGARRICIELPTLNAAPLELSPPAVVVAALGPVYSRQGAAASSVGPLRAALQVWVRGFRPVTPFLSPLAALLRVVHTPTDREEHPWVTPQKRNRNRPSII